MKREGGDSLYDEQLLDKHLEEEKSTKKKSMKADDEVGFDFDENQSLDSDDDEDDTSSEEEKEVASNN